MRGERLEEVQVEVAVGGGGERLRGEPPAVGEGLQRGVVRAACGDELRRHRRCNDEEEQKQGDAEGMVRSGHFAWKIREQTVVCGLEFSCWLGAVRYFDGKNERAHES